MARQKMVAGNWKMNGTRAGNASLVRDIVLDARKYPSVEILVCPPSVYLDSVGVSLKGSTVALGAQNLSDQEKPGAFTGEVLGGMLKDIDCRYVLVGHSERRSLYGETSEIVARKFKAAQAQGLIPVLCLGESLQEREANQTEAVLAAQLKAVLDLCGIRAFKSAVIAYEPVWAIGTGKTASPQQAQDAHAFIRAQLSQHDARIANSLRILYGGSVKADNAHEIFAKPDVDGGLIGGASLKAVEFLSICAAAQANSQL